MLTPLLLPEFRQRQPLQEVCEELNIPICENELRDFCSAWKSRVLGTLIPKNSAEKKVQEYFIEKLNNFENEQFGFFYKIKDSSKKTRGYLFGTIHDTAVFGEHLNLHKKIYRSFNKTKHVAFENDPVTWRQVLYNHSLSSMVVTARSSPIIDLKFSLLAHQQNKTVYDLEPLHLPNASTTQQGKVKPNWPLLYAALYESSEKKLEKFLKEVDTGEDTVELIDRNEKMLEKIIQLLKSSNNERIFIAIGAAHMVGEKGIPNLLSQKKYEIKQIKPVSNDIFINSINKDFFNLSTNTLIFIANSISRTESEAYAPIHREMALYNIIQTLLKKGSKKIVNELVFFIAEKINPGIHRENAFLEIANYEAQQGNIEGALAAAFKMTEHTADRSDAFEYIANILVEKNDIKQAINIMEKYSSTFHYYPGKVALKLAKQGKFEEAIAMAESIQTNRYPKHRDAAFAALVVIMARQGMTERALNSAEKYINQEDVQSIVKASINKIDTHIDIDEELKRVINGAGTSQIFLYGLLNFDDPSGPCLDLLFNLIRKFGLGSAFN